MRDGQPTSDANRFGCLRGKMEDLLESHPRFSPQSHFREKPSSRHNRGKRVAEVDNRRALRSTSQYRRHVLKARDDLLDLSRITSGKVELDIELIDLNEMGFAPRRSSALFDTADEPLRSTGFRILELPEEAISLPQCFSEQL